ncbi:low temperature requirement protein A [Lysobacter sp. 5GHs7-4]|uniref:low temperature requirement protein A n=1 Tax=Lysobacter sp. 5GHs7-4 TaxID=2904253 RepID=UPI001E5A8468|nr:low temperature requirement protein A [Lysobacter sp. 5GHs7-4]UHQ22061.1 low temperature requirement protein A [Lysobacter sp. 5GHs7-4]
MSASARTLLRNRSGHQHGRVTMVELFFDLVFVFAVTQLSHTLLEHLTPAGALQTLLLFFAVWWVWIYTSWCTNWLDPETPPVRLMLFALMLGGLLLSSSLPRAFGERGLLFACAYAAMQVGRTAFMMYALRGRNAALFRNFARIGVWLLVSATLWIAGGLAQGEARYAWWLGALLIEYIGPFAFFWVPGLGRSTIADWDVDGGHLAERCALFVIIALGESILVTGATFSQLPFDGVHGAAFVSAFVGSVAMWWIYFDSGAERASHRIAQAADPGRQARMAYTYQHLLIVGGIIVCAVADEIVLMHPGHVDQAGLAAILGGPALYLLGNALFKWTTNDRRTPPLSHLAGLAALLALTAAAHPLHLSALALGVATTAILVLVALWEWLALRRAVPPAAH